MRGTDEASGSLFSYVDLDERIPSKHPLRKIRQIVNDALASLDPEFDQLYSVEGRPSIAPERLIRASLIQILFSVRSERQLMEQMQYNLLFRWFVGLGIDDPVWVPTVFTKNRDRLLTTTMSRKFMAAILAHREVEPLLSDEHFSVDGTLIKAWASMKSFQPKADTAPPDKGGGPEDPPPSSPPSDASATEHSHTEIEPMPHKTSRTRKTSRNRNVEADFRGQKRSNATHASVTDPRSAVLQEVARCRGHSLLHGPYADGKPQRPDRAGGGHAGRWSCRAEGRRGDGQPPLPRLDPAPDSRCRQGI